MGRESRLIKLLLGLFILVSIYASTQNSAKQNLMAKHQKDSLNMDSLRLELMSINSDTSRVYQLDGFKRTQFNIWFRNTYPNYNGK